MKKIFTFLILAISLQTFAQEAGRSGELLKNEASTSEMQQRNNVGEISGERGSSKNNGQRNSENNSNDYGRSNGSSGIRSTNNYRWNQNYGYSEVFLRIPENGYFTVEVGDQMISNSSGKYRFFDLSSGKIPVSIYTNGYLIYRTQLKVANNSRMVLDFFTNKGLFLLDSYPVQGQMYGFNEWDDVWNNPYNSGWNQPTSPNFNNSGVMNNQLFQQFYNAMLKNAAFDKDKKEFILQQVRASNFTSNQIAMLLKPFSFDSNRLDVAKILYKNCVDKNQYFVVGDAFDFETGRRDLMKFISNQ
ncbi:protein of unknown function [Soonwooa buanensis]|uniref:DUF4476 domain-containing protein n=1 Tax=Soonwooa buanensis TaxID=619805 RepID=A0A1T5G7H8_9FLAO|nr:DUF4476 domain-containing protein [Soonwooa buanensis]SKC04346.1 protein of unknown function [Soonwooa buanensis]